MQGPTGIAGRALSDRRLCAVIVNYEAGRWLTRSVDALLASTVKLEVRVVDNGSTDGSLEPLAERPVEVIRNHKNLGFGRACNQGAAGLADNDLLVFVNPDCVVEPDCLEQMTKAFEEGPSVGMAGAWVMNEDGSVQKATLRRLLTVSNTLGSLLHGDKQPRAAASRGAGTQPAEALSGALLMLSVGCFRSLGGYDEAYFLHCEDLDLMRRAAGAGWGLRLCPDARAVHAQGISHRAAPLRAQAHKHASLCRYYSAELGPLAAACWSALIWTHFVVRSPGWWLAGRRG